MFGVVKLKGVCFKHQQPKKKRQKDQFMWRKILFGIEIYSVASNSGDSTIAKDRQAPKKPAEEDLLSNNLWWKMIFPERQILIQWQLNIPLNYSLVVFS